MGGHMQSFKTTEPMNTNGLTLFPILKDLIEKLTFLNFHLLYGA